MIPIYSRIWGFSTLKMVVTRHGESQCNRTKVWSGWSDAKLTPKGQIEAVQCAKIMQQEGLTFDIAYCSYLSRSANTLEIILDTLGLTSIPIKTRWQLNEKFYGSLQDLQKMPVVKKYGEDIVAEWRRSYRIAPPVVFPDDSRHPINNPKYSQIDPSLLPNSEHLGHVLKRVRQLFDSEIKKDLQEGKRVLVVCHGSVTRVFTNILLNFSQKQSSTFNIPNATPLVAELGEDLKVEKWKILGDQQKIDRLMSKIDNQLKE